MDIQIDERYMSRCLQLAALGCGNVSPNPMVGAVVVHNGKIIGEGFHRRCGQAHAEVNAIASVQDASLLSESTLYVTLEPCSHWGKTPPCSKLILEKQIPRVVVGTTDPFYAVSGRGIRMLREGGVDVKVGVLEKECLELNQAFFTAQNKMRPFVILKWAQSADGYMDRVRTAQDAPVVISNSINSMLVHKMRAETDAILVGTNTVLLDNPRLTVRKWDGKHPVRVFLDRNLRIPDSSSLLDGSTPTLVITEKQGVKRDNVEYITLPFDSDFPGNMLRELMRHDIHSLLVEGGAQTLSTFIDSGLWDEARVETGSMILHQGVTAPQLSGRLKESYQYGRSLVQYYVPKE